MKGKKLNHKKDCKCPFCYKIGKNNPHFGKKHSQELKTRLSIERMGQGNPRFGKEQTIKQKASKKRGKDNNFWKGGITSLVNLIRNSNENKEWRKSIFEHDNYICQECGAANGRGVSVYLEAHHKKEFSIIMQEFLNQYSQFSPIDDKETLARLAITYAPFWEVSNGKTLCRKCHDITKKGRVCLNTPI
jgi:5-methylcytosine-specific restriction endonuclease McrA